MLIHEFLYGAFNFLGHHIYFIGLTRYIYCDTFAVYGRARDAELGYKALQQILQIQVWKELLIEHTIQHLCRECIIFLHTTHNRTASGAAALT